MKKLLLLLSFLSIGFFSQGQNSWKIKLNKKTIFSAIAEDETKNNIKIRRAELNKAGFLEIFYKQTPVNPGWQRSLLFFDSKNTEVFRKNSIEITTKISNSLLKKLYTRESKIKIYTISVPTDPSIAASIRYRRVHLCTLELQ